MSKIIIDTNIYSDAIRGRDYAIHILKNYDTIFLSPIVIGELLFGFKCGNREADNIKTLREFIASPRVQIVMITSETAEFYAYIRSHLKQEGRAVSPNDVWLAASAMEHAAILVSRVSEMSATNCPPPSGRLRFWSPRGYQICL